MAHQVTAHRIAEFVKLFVLWLTHFSGIDWWALRRVFSVAYETVPMLPEADVAAYRR